jgi:hypothetical protein
MRTRTFLLTASAVLVGGVLLAFDARATSTSEAWELCKRNEYCSGNDNGTNVSLCMHGGPAKGKCVQCPSSGKSGSCVVVGKIIPGGGKGTKTTGNAVTGVKDVGTGGGKGKGVGSASGFKPAGPGGFVRRK